MKRRGRCSGSSKYFLLSRLPTHDSIQGAAAPRGEVPFVRQSEKRASRGGQQRRSFFKTLRFEKQANNLDSFSGIAIGRWDSILFPLLLDHHGFAYSPLPADVFLLSLGLPPSLLVVLRRRCTHRRRRCSSRRRILEVKLREGG